MWSSARLGSARLSSAKKKFYLYELFFFGLFTFLEVSGRFPSFEGQMSQTLFIGGTSFRLSCEVCFSPSWFRGHSLQQLCLGLQKFVLLLQQANNFFFKGVAQKDSRKSEHFMRGLNPRLFHSLMTGSAAEERQGYHDESGRQEGVSETFRLRRKNKSRAFSAWSCVECMYALLIERNDKVSPM